MKLKYFYLLLLSLLFVGCMKNEEYADEQTYKERVKANAEYVFGIKFEAYHDWCTTKTGNLTINNIPDNIKKVRLLVRISEDDGETSMLSLNEADITSDRSVVLSYDIPNDNLGLYVAFISSNDFIIRKVSEDNVEYKSRITRTITTEYTLPSEEPVIGIIEDSYANMRGWIPGEKLYQLSDYTNQKITVSDYPDEYKEQLRTLIFSYFKNGKKYNGLPLVRNSGRYNEKVYPLSTGGDPIIVSPIYKNDGGYNEVINSDLYYYYFKESDLGDNPVAYLESLPKYKAIPFVDCIKGDDELCKHASYALIYWGDGIPSEGTVGTYQFPAGYSIGFMIRAKTTAENYAKQGELYGDGRLNNYINNYDKCNFRSSQLGEDGPRMGWITVNGKMLICCESGTDKDFNDIILEIEGGIEPIIVIPDIDYNYYTFCFEDTDFGDYDMNDVVIKARRLNTTQVEYKVTACGAFDDLYIIGINGKVINSNTEVHRMFGTTGGYINTIKGRNFGYVTDTVTVSSSFSFLNTETQPYIYDKFTGKEIKLSRAGEDPHGIMLPYDFRHPLEKICIKDAYLKFNNWGENKIESSDWYIFPEEDFVF